MQPLTPAQLAELTVLVVTDEDDLSQLLMQCLPLCEKQRAYDRVEAMAFFEEQSPDVIFIDLDLEYRSGHRLLERLRSFDDRAFIVGVSGDHSATASRQGNLGRGNQLSATAF